MELVAHREGDRNIILIPPLDYLLRLKTPLRSHEIGGSDVTFELYDYQVLAGKLMDGQRGQLSRAQGQRGPRIGFSLHFMYWVGGPFRWLYPVSNQLSVALSVGQ